MTYTKDAKYGVGDDFEAMPVHAVLGLVEHKLARAKGIECLKNDCGSHGTDETLPHGLVWEVVRQGLSGMSAAESSGSQRRRFGTTHLEAEEHSSDGGAECDRDS